MVDNTRKIPVSEETGFRRFSKYFNFEKNCHCEGEARDNPHPQNLTVLDALRPKWQHFGVRIATSGYALLAMTDFIDKLKNPRFRRNGDLEIAGTDDLPQRDHTCFTRLTTRRACVRFARGDSPLRYEPRPRSGPRWWGWARRGRSAGGCRWWSRRCCSEPPRSGTPDGW